MIAVVTDSSCDLPLDVARHFVIEVVPLTVRLGDRSLLDGRDLSPDVFWRELQASNVLPETAAPSAGQFQEAFWSLQRGGADGIVAVCISSRLSATYQAAMIAADRVDIPVQVVDSEAVSMALGFQVLEAARAARQGDSLDAVVAAAKASTFKVGMLATLDTLEFLRRGGRIGKAQAVVGGLLDIRPILSLENGVIASAGRSRTRRGALEEIADRVVRLLPDLAEIAVLHGAADDLESLLILFSEHIPRDDLMVANIGPVVGTHTGPGAIGVAFRLK